MIFSPPLSTARAADRRRRAVAAVEFALIAPLLAVFLVGLFELGRAIMVKETLSDAARKGCRNAILPAHTTAQAANDAKGVLTDNNIDGTQATVQVLVNGSAATDAKLARPGDQITVQVSIPFA